jgi:hypothetical protein
MDSLHGNLNTLIALSNYLSVVEKMKRYLYANNSLRCFQQYETYALVWLDTCIVTKVRSAVMEPQGPLLVFINSVNVILLQNNTFYIFGSNLFNVFNPRGNHTYHVL